MTKENYNNLNFKCKRLIDQCKKGGQIYPKSKSDEDRCKIMVKMGYIKPIYGSWSGEIQGYTFV